MITLTIKDVNSLLERIETLTREIRTLSTNTRGVMSTVHAHGAAIGRMEKSLENLQYHCPMFHLEEDRKRGVATGNGDDKCGSSPHIYDELEGPPEDKD